ncbi:MAG: hypothetical protein JNG84_11510 [Archangium sp.]|nr:hypothetical protein [Archangium sp.]
MALATVLAFTGAEAWPCRGPFRPFAENARAADLVFIGKLVAVRDIGPVPNLATSRVVELHFDVETRFKGSAPGRVVLRSNTSTCGYGLAEVGQRHLMLARGPSRETSAVSGNQLLTTTAEGEAVSRELRAALGEVDGGR